MKVLLTPHQGFIYRRTHSQVCGDTLVCGHYFGSNSAVLSCCTVSFAIINSAIFASEGLNEVQRVFRWD